jgi:hypothetical protein
MVTFVSFDDRSHPITSQAILHAQVDDASGMHPRREAGSDTDTAPTRYRRHTDVIPIPKIP